mmetsp:Transcript_13027/g.23206  ORF Transcript_13027/g.23206 Transcript_13027/m.23206 type:complete len:221 (-) Transcript_13027:1081-1743(-)
MVYSTSPSAVSGSVLQSIAPVIASRAPSSIVSPEFRVTAGPSFTGFTLMFIVFSPVVKIPSVTVKLKPADSPSSPLCKKLILPELMSACVKVPPASGESSLRTTPPREELTLYTNASAAVSVSSVFNAPTPISTSPPSSTVAMLLLTIGASGRSTIKDMVTSAVVEVPSETVKLKLADVPSEPSCWKVTWPASRSAWVKVPSASGRPFRSTVPESVSVTV